jgi:hypothetical protein
MGIEGCHTKAVAKAMRCSSAAPRREIDIVPKVENLGGEIGDSYHEFYTNMMGLHHYIYHCLAE